MIGIHVDEQSLNLAESAEDDENAVRILAVAVIFSQPNSSLGTVPFASVSRVVRYIHS